MYTYIRSELKDDPPLWTVGFNCGTNNDEWCAESDHDLEEDAEKRASFLNDQVSRVISSERKRIEALEQFMARAIAQFPSLGEEDKGTLRSIKIRYADDAPDAPGDDTRDAALAQMEESVANAEAWAKYAERDRVTLIDRADELEKEVKFRIEQGLRLKARVDVLEKAIRAEIRHLTNSQGCGQCDTEECLLPRACSVRPTIKSFNRLLAGTGEFAPKEKA